MSDGELKREAVTVSVVGRDMSFTILDDDVLDSAIAALNVSWLEAWPLALPPGKPRCLCRAYLPASLWYIRCCRPL